MTDRGCAMYTFDDLSPQARERAIRQIRAKLAGDWWDRNSADAAAAEGDQGGEGCHGPDTADVHAAIVAGLARAMGTAGHCDTSDAVVGIPQITVDSWDFDSPHWIVVDGALAPEAAPGLPWPHGVAYVELVGYGPGGTGIFPMNAIANCACHACKHIAPRDTDCPMTYQSTVDIQKRADLVTAVREALDKAWQAGKVEYDRKTGEGRARDITGAYWFTETGDLGAPRADARHGEQRNLPPPSQDDGQLVT